MAGPLDRRMNEFMEAGQRRYVEECEWRRLLEYGEQRARDMSIGPEDVADLVEECRVEEGRKKDRIKDSQLG